MHVDVSGAGQGHCVLGWTVSRLRASPADVVSGAPATPSTSSTWSTTPTAGRAPRS